MSDKKDSHKKKKNSWHGVYIPSFFKILRWKIQLFENPGELLTGMERDQVAYMSKAILVIVC